MMDLPKPLDFTEALKDSPRFRKELHDHEQYFFKFENKLTEILRLVTAMVEFGQNYVATLSHVTKSISELSRDFFSNDPIALSGFSSISDTYEEVVNLHKVLIEQAHWSMHKNISEFLKCEVEKLHETRVHFENLSSSLDEALIKKATLPRSKSIELSEASNSLTAVGTCFAHTAMDYVAQVNVVHARRPHEIIQAFSSFLLACGTFFNRGQRIFADWTTDGNDKVLSAMQTLKNSSKSVERKVQDRHMLVPKELFEHCPPGMAIESDVVLEGYLFKRASNAFRTWNRRWFQIRDCRLLYRHRTLDGQSTTSTVMESDLKLCLVRPAPATVERACCFELVTPTRSHMLQADSESLCSYWMKALKRTIEHLHEKSVEPDMNSIVDHHHQQQQQQSTTLHGLSPSVTIGPSEPSGRSLLQMVRQVAGNDRCADCSVQDPKWASINLGVVLCIDCCGVHRSLGVQVSKVRSLTMDSFDVQHRRLLLLLGNDRVNAAYLAYLPENDIIPQPAKTHCSQAIREAWIKAKYVERRFSRSPKERTKEIAEDRVANPGKKPCNNGHHKSQSISTLTEDLLESSEFLESTSLLGWRSSPNLDDHPNSPSDSVNVHRLTSCGSDANFSTNDDTVIGVRSWHRTKSQNVCRLMTAIRGSNIAELCLTLAQGVDLNVRCSETTPLLTAIDIVLGCTEVVEYLLLNGARINVLDGQLNSPLHIAASKGHTLQVCQLLKRGAQKELQNHAGLTPLDLAVEGKFADIVTLLRLQLMREEFSDEFNNPMDETFDGIMNDIANKANY